MRPVPAIVAIAACTTVFVVNHAVAADWLQFGYDSTHSGVNPIESEISKDNVSSLVELAQSTLPASLSSSPVLLSGVETSSGRKNVLFLTATSGTLFAVDAVNGFLLWSHQPPGGVMYTQSSPAIDSNRLFVYSYGLDGKVHKYRVGNGQEITDQGWPQIVTLKPSVEHGAAALAIGDAPDGNSYLYAVTNGYNGDNGDYQGHLTSVDLRSGTQVVFNVLCSDSPGHFIEGGAPGVTDCGSTRAGIWGRPGAVFDAVSNRVYITTANGPFNANFGGFNWGDSVLALPPDGHALNGLPLDSYTPSNYQALENFDLDLGSGSLAIIGEVPGSKAGRLGVIVGKDNTLRLLALDDLSGNGGPRHVGGELQSIAYGSASKCNTPQPAVWKAPDGSVWIYATVGSLTAYQLVANTSGVPELQMRWTSPGSGTPVIANGIVFSIGYNAMYALDAISGQVLWQSLESVNVQWQSPIIANGRLYVGANDVLHIFGPDEIFLDGFDGSSGTKAQARKNRDH